MTHHLSNLLLSQLYRLCSSQEQAVNSAAYSIPKLKFAIRKAVERLEKTSGRMIYVGAGSSGHLAALDAYELKPTFSWPESRSVSLIAGKDQRFDWVDGYAEDDTNYVVQQCQELALSENDIVIGVSASGDTPYTATALREARAAGALTIMLSANPDKNFCSTAEITINVALPDEVIHGSTRLAAGTAHKMMLNSLSTGIMTQLGRVYKGHMVAMDVTNQKLQRRAIKIVTDITGATEIQARHKLSLVNYDIRQAILILKGADVHQAVALLDECYGHLGKAIKALPRHLKPRLLKVLSARS